MEERNKTGPLYYCHVFWHKSVPYIYARIQIMRYFSEFVSVQLPKSSTCLDLLEAAKESLCTKQDEDRDVESASSRLAYNGYIITDVSCKVIRTSHFLIFPLFHSTEFFGTSKQQCFFSYK